MTRVDLLGRKIIAVSDGRRITIPKNFYSQLSFGDRVECFVRGNELVIRPANHSGEDFPDLIAAELSEQGLTGEDLNRDEVLVRRIGEIIMLVPKKNSLAGILASLDIFTDDFMAEGRVDFPPEKRDSL